MSILLSIFIFSSHIAAKWGTDSKIRLKKHTTLIPKSEDIKNTVRVHQNGFPVTLELFFFLNSYLTKGIQVQFIIVVSICKTKTQISWAFELNSVYMSREGNGEQKQNMHKHHTHTYIKYNTTHNVFLYCLHQLTLSLSPAYHSYLTTRPAIEANQNQNKNESVQIVCIFVRSLAIY